MADPVFAVVLQWTEEWTVLIEQTHAANMAVRSGLEDGNQSQVCMQSGNLYEVTRSEGYVVVERVARQ